MLDACERGLYGVAMPRFMVFAWALSSLALGCHGRSVPSSVPQGSALSVAAAPVASPSVIVALEEDPPLEGDLSRWPELGGAAPASNGGHQHHHHGAE
jgi:hypothetical protein